MREIKFRAWQDEKMVFSPLSSNYGLNRFFGFLYEDAPIMQYTGLKDKNGKEIYEGDIISNPRYEETYIVEYHIDGYVGWGDDRRSGCYLISDDDIEVVGNIHENPELLNA